MSRCCRLPIPPPHFLLLFVAAYSLLHPASGQPVWETCRYGVDTDHGHVSWDLSSLSYSTLSYTLPNSSTTAYFTPCSVVQQPNCTAAVDPLQPVFCLQTLEANGSVTVDVLTVLGIVNPSKPLISDWLPGDPDGPPQFWPPAQRLWNGLSSAAYNSCSGYSSVYVNYLCNAYASTAFISDVSWTPYNWVMLRPSLTVQTAIMCNATVRAIPAGSGSSTADSRDSDAGAGFASGWSTTEVLLLALLDTAVLVAFCLGVCLLARHLRRSEPAYDNSQQLQMQAVLLEGADLEQTGGMLPQQQQQPEMPTGRVSSSPVPGFLPWYRSVQVQPMT